MGEHDVNGGEAKVNETVVRDALLQKIAFKLKPQSARFKAEGARAEGTFALVYRRVTA